MGHATPASWASGRRLGNYEAGLATAGSDRGGAITHHDVLIVGGGNAGVSLAARLRRDGCPDVALVDPVDTHRYRPLLSYVGGGQATMARVERPQADVIPAGVRWYQERVQSVDPLTRTVRTEAGPDLSADDLVLCPGVEQDWESVPGSRAAVFAPTGASNYVDERAEATWELVSQMRSGTAVFVVCGGPVPCAGAGLKPLFLAADHWRRTGVLDDIDITVVLGWPTIFGIERVDRELDRYVQRYGISVITDARVSAIDPVTQTLTFTTQRGGSDGVEGEVAPEQSIGYDLLHYVPSHRAPSWVQHSGLADDAAVGDGVGMIAVSPTTLAHRHYPGVWGLGDAADVQASRSGGALRKQVAVVADNITRRRAGRELVSYDGYSTAPITVARNRLVLAEFDRTGAITPSVPVIDLVRARILTWAYDLYLQPLLYWHSILKGRVSR